MLCARLAAAARRCHRRRRVNYLPLSGVICKLEGALVRLQLEDGLQQSVSCLTVAVHFYPACQSHVTPTRIVPASLLEPEDTATLEWCSLRKRLQQPSNSRLPLKGARRSLTGRPMYSTAIQGVNSCTGCSSAQHYRNAAASQKAVPCLNPAKAGVLSKPSLQNLAAVLAFHTGLRVA